MAISSATVLEVRSTGSDNNGGGFVTGASGTDFSQQDAAQYALTGVTTAAADAIMLSASAAANMVGNLAQVMSGTNFTVGSYQILSVVVGVSITVDRNCTSAAGALGVVNIGGAFATIAKGLALMTVTGHQMYVKATATYSISTGLSTPAGIDPALGINRIIGYTTTRTDLGRVTIQTSAAVAAYTDSRGGFRLENFVLDGNSTGTIGAVLSGANSIAFNCIIKNFTTAGVTQYGAEGGVLQSEITACALGYQNGANGAVIKNNYIHANTGAAIEIIGGYVQINGNIIANNTGGSSDGIIFNAAYSANASDVTRNVFYANGRDGCRYTGQNKHGEIANNIFMNNVGIGLNTSVMSPVRTDVLIHHNAYYGNGTARSGNNAGTGDVTLTADPFTNAAGNDFSLNGTAGGGAALKAVGYPGALLLGGTGYIDIGALQSQAAAGGGGGVAIVSW